MADAPDFGLSLEECLRIPPFDRARVISGGGGLGRRVRWVHVVDHDDVESSLTGQELILTSGVTLGHDLALQRALFPIMDRLNIAGIGISLGTYMERVPEAMLAESERRGIPIIAIPWEVNFRDITYALLTRLLEAQHDFLVGVDQLHRDLLGLVVRQGDLTAVCDHVARLAGRSVLVTDPAFQILARRIAGSGADSLLVRREGLAPEIIRAAAAVERGVAQGRAFAVSLPEGAPAGVMAPIMFGGQLRGWLFIQNDGGAIRRLDLMAAEAAALVAALLLSHAAELARAAESGQEGMLLDLLDGNASIGEGQISTLDLVEGDPFAVFVAELAPGGADAAAGIIRNLLVRLPARGALVQRGDSVIGLLQRPKAVTVAEAVTRLARLLEQAKLQPRLAMSAVRNDLNALGAAYAEARDTLRLGRILEPAAVLLRHDDHVALAAFLRAVRNGGAEPYPAISRLQEQDRSQQGSLVETLECYLDADGNASVAARRLGIHRHTLLYRLTRIGEVLGSELTPALRFELRLQLLAWHLSGGPRKSGGSASLRGPVALPRKA